MSLPVRVGAVLILALVVQLTVFVDVRVAGVAPELLTLVAVIAGFFVGPDRGPVIAFAAGLIWDMYLPSPLGVSAVTLALVAFAVGSLEEGLFHDSRSQLIAVAGLASAAAVVSYALVGELVGVRGLIDLDMLRVALIVGVLNAALSPVAAPIMEWALRGQADRR